MAKVTIDGNDYEIDDLSSTAKEQWTSLQFVQAQINKINGELAIYKTAQAAYSTALKNELPKE